MNSVLVGYEELLRPRLVLSAEASASADNTNRGLNNSSYPTRPHSIIVYYYYYQIHFDVVIRMNSTNTTTVIYSLGLIIFFIFNRIIRLLKDTKGYIYKTSTFHLNQGETIKYIRTYLNIPNQSYFTSERSKMEALTTCLYVILSHCRYCYHYSVS